MTTQTHRQAHIEDLCEALALGVSRRAACALAGISHETLYRWLQDGQTDADGVTVRDRIARAEAECERAAVKALRSPWDGKEPGEAARAAEAFLKRHPRTRAEWGDRLDVRVLDDDTLLRLLQATEARDVQRIPDGQTVDGEFLPEPAQGALPAPPATGSND